MPVRDAKLREQLYRIAKDVCADHRARAVRALCELAGYPALEIGPRREVKAQPKPTGQAVTQPMGPQTETARKGRIIDPAAMAEYVAKHDWCEVLGCRFDPCPEPHHLVSRKMKGDDVPSNLIRLCLLHHSEWHTIGGRSWLVKYGVRLPAETRGKVERALRIEPEMATEAEAG